MPPPIFTLPTRVIMQYGKSDRLAPIGWLPPLREAPTLGSRTELARMLFLKAQTGLSLEMTRLYTSPIRAMTRSADWFSRATTGLWILWREFPESAVIRTARETGQRLIPPSEWLLMP